MLKHVVMYRLKDKTPEVIKTIKANFAGMEGKISGLIKVESGEDVLRSARSFDYCLVCVFDGRASLEAYQTHPAHLPVKAFMKTVVESSVAVDFEF